MTMEHPVVQRICFVPGHNAKKVNVFGFPTAPNWLLHQGTEITREQVFTPLRKITRGAFGTCGALFADEGMEAEEATSDIEEIIASFDLPELLIGGITTFVFYWWIAPWIIKKFSGPFQMKIPPGVSGAVAAEAETRLYYTLPRGATVPITWDHISYNSGPMIFASGVGTGFTAPVAGMMEIGATIGLCAGYDAAVASCGFQHVPGGELFGFGADKVMTPGACKVWNIHAVYPVDAFDLIFPVARISGGVWPVGVTNNTYQWATMGGCVAPEKPDGPPPRPKKTYPVKIIRPKPPRPHRPYTPKVPHYKNAPKYHPHYVHPKHVYNPHLKKPRRIPNAPIIRPPKHPRNPRKRRR